VRRLRGAVHDQVRTQVVDKLINAQPLPNVEGVMVEATRLGLEAAESAARVPVGAEEFPPEVVVHAMNLPAGAVEGRNQLRANESARSCDESALHASAHPQVACTCSLIRSPAGRGPELARMPPGPR
jgi:hypothetical protein